MMFKKACQRRQDLGKRVRCIDWSLKVKKKFGWEEDSIVCVLLLDLSKNERDFRPFKYTNE